MTSDIQNTPLVTIAIPTFNRANYLAETIESALSQTYKNIEILISDNASSDDTQHVIQCAHETDPRVRSLKQARNLGMVGNWNACLEEARGDYFLLLSDDDLLVPDAVETLVSGLEEGYACVAYGKVNYFGEHDGVCAIGAPKVESGLGMVIGHCRGERVAYPSATLVRTRDARCCGGYPDVGTATDFAMLLLLLKDGTVRFFDQPIAYYRKHESALSLTDNAANSYLTFYEWLENQEFLPRNWIYMLQARCRAGIHRWGWSQALRGNDAGSFLAIEILRKMQKSSMHLFLLSLRHFPAILWIGRIFYNRRRN